MSCFHSSNYFIYWNDGNGAFTFAFELPASRAGSCTAIVDFDRSEAGSPEAVAEAIWQAWCADGAVDEVDVPAEAS